MKPILLALLPLLAAAATSPEIDALIAAASAAPAEFQADSLIRISSLETLEKARRVELLSQAFDRASAAQQPYRRTIAVTRVAGPVGAVNKAYAQDLDALSLRLRAVEGMLALDAGKARQLFARIPPLQLPKAACTDFLVYDVRRYYDVLERIVRAADASEKRVILEGAAAAIASPVQVGPMARVLTFADVPDETFTAGIVAFGAAMAKISGDDRSFTFAHQVGREIESLTDECRRRKVSPLRMLEGYRVYLVFNLSGARCLSDAIQAGGLAAFATVETAQAPMNPVGHFNEKLQTAPLQPIHELESTPSRVEGSAAGLRDCKEPQCVETASVYRELMIGPQGAPIPQFLRSTPQWAEKLNRVLESLAAWKPTTSFTALDLFRERSGVYGNLLNLAPAGASRNLVTRAMLQFAARHALQKTNRMEWFLPVNSLIARSTIDPLGYRDLLAELKKSTDPVIALYAQIEAIAPRPADRILGLL